MSGREIALWAVLVAFTLFTLGVVREHGVMGFVEYGFLNGVTVQVGLDLIIMLALFAVWMVGDARERGIAAWPFLVLMCAAGSIGAMLYLVRRARVPARAPVPA